MSALSGLDVRLRISAETCSLVLRTVSRQSLASLLGSTRPRIPTLPAEDMWSTPANTRRTCHPNLTLLPPFPPSFGIPRSTPLKGSTVSASILIKLSGRGCRRLKSQIPTLISYPTCPSTTSHIPSHIPSTNPDLTNPRPNLRPHLPAGPASPRRTLHIPNLPASIASARTRLASSGM